MSVNVNPNVNPHPPRPPRTRTEAHRTATACHLLPPASSVRQGIAFSAKRKRANASTLQDLLFSRINLP